MLVRASPKGALRAWCVVVSCCFLGSCAHWPLYTVTTQEVPTLAADPPQRIPLRAGFFMDERFQEVAYGGRGVAFYHPGHKTAVDFDVRAAFEQATRRMFQEVVPVTATETSIDWQAKNLDVLVFAGRASCVSDWGRERWPPNSQLIYATFIAEWSVMSPDGKMITRVRPAGEGQAPRRRSLIGLKEALVQAVDAHVGKVYDNIVMSAWWRDSSWKSN
jgi:hypothetical protein